MKKILILLMLLCGLFMYATDDYMTNNPRYRIINPADGNTPRWNETYNAFDCGSTTGVVTVDSEGGGNYTTIQGALDAINTLAVAEAAAGTYGDSKYILNIAPGTYTENLTIQNQKYLKINMAGVKIVGTVKLTTTQQTGDYYSKIEFVGGMSNRPEKGDNAEITGNITGTRNNDSPVYLSFTGIELSGNLGFTTNGTWVVFMNHCYMSNGSGYFYGDFSGAGTPSVLLGTMGLTRLKAHIADTDNSTTEVSLYDVIDTEFDLIDITPSFGGTIRNCEFKSDVTISSGTYEMDNFSYGEAARQTEDFTGATITYMDNNNGGDVTVVGNLSAGTYSIDAGEYMLLPASGTLTNNQFAGARVITLTAGYGTTAIGDLVYLNNDDSKFEKTDGNAAATAADVLVGVVLQAVAEDASCLILLEGTITVDAWNWATVGASVWISGTAGGFVQTRLAVANDIVRIMGYAIDDDTIYFCPDNAYVTVE